MPLIKGCWQLDNFYRPSDLGQRETTDCYFYYYSSCKNGNMCQYRHEPRALGHEVMCSRWLEGHCDDPHCTERHMLIVGKRRDRIPCFWENTPFGCTKVHCVFRHSVPRTKQVANERKHSYKQEALSCIEESSDQEQESQDELETVELNESVVTATVFDGIENNNSEESKYDRNTTDANIQNYSLASSGIYSLIEDNLSESQADFSSDIHDMDVNKL